MCQQNKFSLPIQNQKCKEKIFKKIKNKRVEGHVYLHRYENVPQNHGVALTLVNELKPTIYKYT